jgi:hypothetical protein
MLQAVVQAGQYERAVQMLDDMYLYAEGGGPTGKCLEVVVRAHLERGELEEALDTLSIFSNRPSIQTFMLMVRWPAPPPPSAPSTSLPGAAPRRPPSALAWVSAGSADECERACTYTL